MPGLASETEVGVGVGAGAGVGVGVGATVAAGAGDGALPDPAAPAAGGKCQHERSGQLLPGMGHGGFSPMDGGKDVRAPQTKP